METFTVVGAGPAAYERYLVPVLFRPLAVDTLRLVGLQAGERLLDAACGTGVVARLAHAAGAQVTGLDVNSEMLATAQQLEPGVAWLQRPAEATELPDGRYAVVTCQQGLQFCTDPVAALRELHRVLAPGGRLAVALWCRLGRAPGFAAIVDVLDRHAGPELGDVLRAPFRLGAATAVYELAAAAGLPRPRTSIRGYQIRFASPSAMFDEEVAATPLAGPVAALPAGVRAAMIADLSTQLAEHIDDDGLVFPIETHLFTWG
jgi:SAM-dependent methyltransferase